MDDEINTSNQSNQTTPSKRSSKYVAISLSSGSARGIYQLGALHAAECMNLDNDIKVFSGTSVGAILALLLAIGWKPLDLFSYICVNDISKHIPLTFDITMMFKRWGCFDTSPFRDFLSKCITTKYGGVPSFKELADQGIYFICTAYRLKHSNPNVYFSYQTHPNMNVLDAAMLSANIPLLFPAQNYEGDYYVDGGVFDLNPAKYVESFCKSHQLDGKIFSISLQNRSTSREDDVIYNIGDYIKEIAFINVYNQPLIKSTETIHNINLETDDRDAIKIHIPNKTKVNWFCSGLKQGIAYLETIQASKSEEDNSCSNSSNSSN